MHAVSGPDPPPILSLIPRTVLQPWKPGRRGVHDAAAPQREGQHSRIDRCGFNGWGFFKG
jgi:hypothetical protein